MPGPMRQSFEGAGIRRMSRGGAKVAVSLRVPARATLMYPPCIGGEITAPGRRAPA